MKRFWTPTQQRVKVGKGVAGISYGFVSSKYFENILAISYRFVSSKCFQNIFGLSHAPHECSQRINGFVRSEIYPITSIHHHHCHHEWEESVEGLIFNSHPVQEISFAITGDPLIIPPSLSLYCQHHLKAFRQAGPGKRTVQAN